MSQTQAFFTSQRSTLIAVAISTFMLPLDFTVVSVALHDIEIEFAASFTDLQWVVNGYTLMYAAMLMAGGTLADRFGRRLIYTLGIGLFMISSLTCGLAGSPLMLNISRAFQGIGAALMFSASIPLLVQEFTGAARVKAFGIFGLVVGTGAALGPLLGGIIIHLLGWRWAFLINIPIGIAVTLLILWKIKESKDPNAHSFDIVGFLTFTSSFLCLVYAIIMGNSYGWSSLHILAILSLSVVLFLAFLYAESKASYPMIDLNLFKDIGYIGISLTTVLLSIGFWWMILYVPLYFQSVMQYSALQAGAAVLPFAIPLFIMGPVGAKLSLYLNSRTQMAMGMALVGTGAGLMLVISNGSGWLSFVPGALIAAAGTGLINGEIINVAMSMVPAERSGMASGITGTMRQLGVALGFAGMGALFSNVTIGTYARLSTQSGIPKLSDSSLPLKIIQGNFLHEANNLPVSIRDTFIKIAQVSFFEGFHTLLWVAMGVSFTGAILAYLLIPKNVRSIKAVPRA